MHTEMHGWHSSRLGRHMGVVVYGHYGPPLLGFPTSGGDEWELDTTGMQPCGYVVLLHVVDRSIINSHPGSHNDNYYDVGFCLRAASK